MRLTSCLLGMTLMGCSAPRVAPLTPPPVVAAPPAPPPKGMQPALVEPTVGVEEVAAELATTVTTSDDELVSFVERTTGEGLPRSSDWLDAPPPARNGSRTARMGLASGKWTCVARRTSSDERAAVMRSSKAGFPVVPMDWMAKVVRLRGAKEEDVRAWYQAMSRRVATAGRATGLARFANGNAIAILLEVELREDVTDITLVAKTQFMKAGEYNADAWGPVILGAENVQTMGMNHHGGVSVVDLLRDLRPAKGRSDHDV